MSINIKKSHRGKFTAYKRRTGKSTSEALHSKDKNVRAMANFARMAKRHWKKLEDGGILIPELGNGDWVPRIQTPTLTLPTFPQFSPPTTIAPTGFMPDSSTGTGGNAPKGIDPITLAVNAGLGIGDAITGNIAATSELREQNAYSTAQENMRYVNTNQMGNYGRNQSITKNWWNLGIGSIGSKKRAKEEAEMFNERMKKLRFQKDVGTRLNTMGSETNYAPVMRQGGFISYRGDTHNNPSGGILVDKLGNPVDITEGEAVAYVEGGGKKKEGEVTWYNPTDQSAYVYSDKNGDAKPMRKLIKDFGLDKPLSLYKTDTLVQTMVDQKAKNIKTAAEFAKETKIPYSSAEPIFSKGGTLTADKAGEILRDGTVHGHKLTPKQRRFMGWVRGGRKEDGGYIDMFTDGGKFSKKRDSNPVIIAGHPIATLAANLGRNLYKRRKLILSELSFSPNDTVSSLATSYKSYMTAPTSTKFSESPFGTYNPMDWVGEFLRTKARRRGYVPTEGRGGIKAIGMYEEAPEGNTGMVMKKPSTTILTEKKTGGYIRKKKHSIFPFLPIPEAPTGAYTHSAVEEFGGELPILQNGSEDIKNSTRDLGNWLWDPIKATFNIKSKYIPSPSKNYPVYQSKTYGSYGGADNINYIPQLNLPSTYGTVEGFFDQQNKSGPGYYNHLWGDRMYDPTGLDYHKDSEIPTINLPTTKVIQNPNTITPNTGMNPLFFQRYQQMVRDRQIGPQDKTQSTASLGFRPNYEERQYNPVLSPLGHILSGVGTLADYSALKKARPTKVSLSRMGPERISLAKQRLANERNAAVSRAINTSSARGLGLNPGATYANTVVANTGVNRLLGQQNAQLLETEENTNAQLRQQAAGINAELAAQEALFNAQREDAYRMLKAKMNPLGNLSRVAASYFADNAAYGRGYDTLRMLAPNAETYQEPDTTWIGDTIRWLGGHPKNKVRLKDKSL
jgi:hypothetical protein